MATLWNQLETILPQVLPSLPEDAINGTEILALVIPRLEGKYEESTIRQHLSNMSAEPTSVIARVAKGHGYYLRPSGSVATQGATDNRPTEPTNGGTVAKGQSSPPNTELGDQAEEKFRAVFMRYAALDNRFPMRIDHTRAERQAAGTNKWKFPDVVLLDWDVGEVSDEGYRLDSHFLDVKRSLGDQPFRLTSVELKVELSVSNFRESFFQCVSNSKWAHHAILAVAVRIADTTLATELRRLGTSYDVSVLSYSIDRTYLSSLPNTQEIMSMGDDAFDDVAKHVDIQPIATGRPRDGLDWDHVRDMRARTDDFVSLFKWISYCLSEVRPFTFDDYVRLSEITQKYA